MAIEIPEPGRRASRVIAVWEPRPWWAPQLQHRFSRGEVGVRECRQLQDVVAARPEVVIVASSDASAERLQNIAELCGAGTGAFVVVVIPGALRAAEWRLRDLGAAVVVGEDVGADALAAICRRALRRSPEPSDHS